MAKLTDAELNQMLEDLDLSILKGEQAAMKAAIGFRRLRKKLGLSIEEAAERCDITPYAIAELEKGEYDPSIKIFSRFVYALSPEVTQNYSIVYQGQELCPQNETYRG